MTAPALEGIVVLDITDFEAGPLCTESLAWLGATVIKVERPGTGSQMRGASTTQPGMDSHGFILLNANKKSITLNIKDTRARHVIQRLIERADVLIENLGPGAIERMHLDYETVREMNPRLIYAQIKGYGTDGPYAEALAFDPTVQAMGGSLSLTGEMEGPPMRPGPTIADSGAGYQAVIGILAALLQRQATGRGQRIEVAMQDTVISFCRSVYSMALMTGRAAGRYGNGMPIAYTAPAGIYPCAPLGPNDYCYIYTSRAPKSEHWPRLLRAIGREDMLDDERFATPESRWHHRAVIDEALSAWTRTRSKYKVMDIISRAGVPAGAVQTTEELMADPYTRRRMFATVNHPVRGEVLIPGWPVRMSDTDVPITSSPLLGEHNDDVFRHMLGMSAEEIEALGADGTI